MPISTDSMRYSYERRIRERPYIYLYKFVRRAQPVSDEAMFVLLDNGVAAGHTGHLALEITDTADQTHCVRAIRRARVIQAATSIRTLPIVCGRRIPPEIRAELEAAGGGWVEIDAETPDVT